MQTLITIPAGVALGILIAFAVIHWGRWLPTTVSTARQLVLITYPRRKALPLLVIVSTTALAALFALYRAEKTMREAEASTFRLWISQNRTRPRIEYLTHRSSAHGGSVLGAAFRRVNIIAGLADDDVQGFGAKRLAAQSPRHDQGYRL